MTLTSSARTVISKFCYHDFLFYFEFSQSQMNGVSISSRLRESFSDIAFSGAIRMFLKGLTKRPFASLNTALIEENVFGLELAGGSLWS